jgi:sugar phosphate isomerase/epimerase
VISRREFIKGTLFAVAADAAGTALPAGASGLQPRLSFSTLGCPAWSLDYILDFAGRYGYKGIELRGLLGELDLTRRPEFTGKTTIISTRKKIGDKGLSIVDLGSSCQLHHADKKERKSNLDEARRYIDLAQALDCPYIRVFPDKLPGDRRDTPAADGQSAGSRIAAMDLIGEGLLELAEHAKGSEVSVLLESHGDCLWIKDLRYIMKYSAGPRVGMVWDIYNMWSVTKEAPSDVYRELKDHIRHTHIKDGRMIDGKEHYVLLGRGDAPVAGAVKALQQGGYDGFYSLEWEKWWHPEIDEPDVALSQFPTEMKKYF